MRLVDAEAQEAFARLWHQQPVVVNHFRGFAPRAMKVSDFLSDRHWRRTAGSTRLTANPQNDEFPSWGAPAPPTSRPSEPSPTINPMPIPTTNPVPTPTTNSPPSPKPLNTFHLGSASAAVRRAGKVHLAVGLRPSAKRSLRENGRLRLRATVTFTPTGGTRSTETVKLTPGAGQRA